MRYYKVIIQLGHMGRRRSADSVLYIKSKDLLSAMKQAQSFPGVKHSKIPNICEIAKEEYMLGLKEQKYTKMMKSIELKTM